MILLLTIIVANAFAACDNLVTFTEATAAINGKIPEFFSPCKAAPCVCRDAAKGGSGVTFLTGMLAKDPSSPGNYLLIADPVKLAAAVGAAAASDANKSDAMSKIKSGSATALDISTYIKIKDGL